MSDPILSIHPLGFPWPCFDPFLFCAYHLDAYPAGDEQMGPAASLEGRSLGQDFEGKDGWNMYHGQTVPGFPQHPHRGFETLTYVRQGLVDHSDSLGATARYGQGDAQWLTTGAGISHTEMFPLLKRDGPNPLELFQIWLNLAPAKKLAQPRFSILWADAIPRFSPGPGVELALVAGALEGRTPPAPPPDSWASHAGTEVAVWTLGLQAGARWTLPHGPDGVDRTLYFFKGAALAVGGREVQAGSAIRLRQALSVELSAGREACELLLLQGRPIGEPVAAYGPFVMNTRAQLQQAFEDYQRTRFGGWPWKDDAPVHGREAGRFARFADGRQETPGA